MKALLLIAVGILLSACQARHDAPDFKDRGEQGVVDPGTFKALQGSFFTKKCAGCHKPGSRSGLDLTTYEVIMSEPGLVVPGKPLESDLYKVVAANEMPKNRPLSDSEKEMLFLWIESGAPR